MAISRRLAPNYDPSKSVIIALMMTLFLFSACSYSNHEEVDELNARSYSYHYKNLDSTQILAERALRLSEDYDAGAAEALNNLAFVSIARMEYDHAYRLLQNVEATTDNQIELLVADVQYMRLCQRRSKNKDFYDYREQAVRRISRINEEARLLTAHQRKRVIYAKSEFDLIASVYFYYVGLKDQSVRALENVDPDGEIRQDTAQVLSLFYNIGAGGIITSGDPYDICQQEFDYLVRCYMLATQNGYVFFEAQSLQAISEHFQRAEFRDRLIRDNLPVMKYLNKDNMPDSLLAGNLAQRALELFTRYGDVYQIAGSYRTLAECYWAIQDYPSALICLKSALEKNEAINQAPDLVASIREQLCLVYSAVDDKMNSDRNRNIYLDLQEQTRQDRQLEARAGQLNASSTQLNMMIVAVVVMIFLVVLMLLMFARMRRKADSKYSPDTLLKPLERWKQETEARGNAKREKQEELNEQIQLAELHILNNKKRNLEQRAKIFLVNSIMPFIDRMINEVNRLQHENEPREVQAERYTYIAELTDKINDYNGVLTQWIQMCQGELRLQIESFPLQDLFDMVRKGRMSYQLKGIELNVEPTTAVVKADKTLTLFMVNTLADNARKFTPRGGTVTIAATVADQYVEIMVRDNGIGMSQTQLEHLFDHKPIHDDRQDDSEHSHGFGLMNCKGIIEKYKKISSIFNVCMIQAESTLGSGSAIRFRLPRGIIRLMAALLMGLGLSQPLSAVAANDILLTEAQNFADSVYFSNINGNYHKALQFADSCRTRINAFYLHLRPKGKCQMVASSNTAETPAEIRWFREGLPLNYELILDVRNESAVAALALHLWDLYHYNNAVYTQLFRERSADNTLPIYVRTMQRSESNKTVAVILLLLLLVSLFPAYYFLYYRHQLYYRFYVERINRINEILLGKFSPEDKLALIQDIWKGGSQIDRQRFATLDRLVMQIRRALRQSIESGNQQSMSIELAEDELHRAEYEDARLHVSNSVLDNCLSTLKHETMYYPSRIRQLIDEPERNLQAISELVNYYKELYAVLSAQAMRQIEISGRVDEDMVRFLFEILKKQNGGVEPASAKSEIDDRYFRLTLLMDRLSLSPEQADALFTPNTSNIQFLLCRQIVREIGEATNARGCGILAMLDQNQVTNIHIILPQSIWKSLK